MSNPHLVIFFNQLNQAFKNKQTLVACLYSKNVHQFLVTLKRNNLIYGYTFTSQRTVLVYLILTNNLPLFSKLFIYSTPKQLLTFSYSIVTKFLLTPKTWIRPVYIFATNSGFLTAQELVQKRSGGKLVVILS